MRAVKWPRVRSGFVGGRREGAHRIPSDVMNDVNLNCQLDSPMKKSTLLFPAALLALGGLSVSITGCQTQRPDDAFTPSIPKTRDEEALAAAVSANWKQWRRAGRAAVLKNSGSPGWLCRLARPRVLMK